MRENERKNMVDGGEAGSDAAARVAAESATAEADAAVKARQKQWDNKQVPDDLLMSEDELDDKKNPWQDSQGNSRRKPIHAIYFKHPRNRKTSGYIDDAQLDNPDVKKELIDKKLVTYKPDDVDQKNPFFDAHFEYGGGDNYSAFLGEMNDPTNTDPLKPFTQGSGSENHGIVPKAGVSQEQIALAFDLWEQRKKVVELTQQEQDEKEQTIDADEGIISPTEANTPPSPGMVEAEDRAKALEVQLAQQAKQDQETQKLKDLQEKKITEPEAQEMLKKLKELEKRERELRKKLANAKPEEKAELELQLKRLTQDKFTEVLKALGYSPESITQLLSNESNLPVVMRLVRHTSRSKDFQSPAVREICRFAKHELISSVQELLNKDPKKQKEYSWNEVRAMTGVDALRRAMSALGITDSHTQDDKIFELFNSANAPKSENGQDLHITNKDTLTVLLEALVTGEPTADVERNLKGWMEDLQKEFEKVKKDGENFSDWLKKRLDQLHPEIGEAAAIAVAQFLENHLNMSAFMDMLLLGDTYTSLARDLGYKSKEELKAEGKKPVDVDEVDTIIRASGNHAENARSLLCAGIKDIIHEDVRSEYLNGSAVAALTNPTFRDALEVAFSKDHHKLFSTQLLEHMGKGDEKNQEANKIALTNEAMTYIMNLPMMAKHLKWEDGGGAEKKNDGGEKKAAAEVKKEEKKDVVSGASPEAATTTAEAPTAQIQTPVSEVKTET